MSRTLSPLFQADDSQAADAQNWELPDIGDAQAVPERNAVNLQRQAAQPEPEPEKAPELPTLAEIEAIQVDARKEGFEQGHSEGHQQGVEQGRLKGLEEGHQQGFEQGLEQGLAEGKARIDAQVAQWQQLLAELVEPLKAVDNQIERELVELTLNMARAVIGCEVKTHAEPLLVALRQGIDALPSKDCQVTIEACAEDLELINQSYGEQELHSRDWRLQLEPSLSRGSLRLLTKRSQVELDLAARMEAVLEQVINRPRGPVAEPEYPDFSPQTASPADNGDAEPEQTASSTDGTS